MAIYLINLEENIVLCQSPTRTLSLTPGESICEGDDNLNFPVIEIREDITGENISTYPYVVENVARMETYKSIKVEFEELNAEVIVEDYEHGNLLPKLKKLARLKQLELILASGNF